MNSSLAQRHAFFFLLESHGLDLDLNIRNVKSVRWQASIQTAFGGGLDILQYSKVDRGCCWLSTSSVQENLQPCVA